MDDETKLFGKKRVYGFADVASSASAVDVVVGVSIAVLAFEGLKLGAKAAVGLYEEVGVPALDYVFNERWKPAKTP